MFFFLFNPALHAAAAASEAEEKETKMRALAPSPGTLTVAVFYVGGSLSEVVVFPGMIFCCIRFGLSRLNKTQRDEKGCSAE